MRIALAAILVIAAPAIARADAPAAAAVLAIDPGEADAIAARLRGQRFTITADRRAIAIDDIAGDGRPWVGVVERRGEALWLVTEVGAIRLRGPLARPRITGPGYAIWVVGDRAGDALDARRVGVLRRPR